MARIFFAINLSAHIREELTKLRLRIPADKKAMKWVAAENLHLTLQFIGEVGTEEMASMLEKAQAAAKRCRPFELEVRGLGAFPNPARPRVIWAGVTTGREQLINLAEQLSVVLDSKPDKPFAPHLTLGRVRENHKVNLSQFLQEEAQTRVGNMAVDRFSCVQSTLTPRGPDYRVVEEFILD